MWLSERQYFATAGVLGMNRDFVRFNLKKKDCLDTPQELDQEKKR